MNLNRACRCLSDWVMTSIKHYRFTEIMQHENAGKKFPCGIN